MKVLLATRSAGKETEIRRLLGPVEGLELTTLDAEGLEPAEEEDDLEVHQTFEENARAKALYFRERSNLPTLADDSGLVVDALGGVPGVRSKRFARAGDELAPEDRDRANNEHLLERLREVDLPERTARFVCVAVLALDSDDVRTFRGEAEGLILGMPRGQGGFGYDPLFYDRALGRTFAELSRSEKNRRSHRGKAFREVGRFLQRRPEGPDAAPGGSP